MNGYDQYFKKRQDLARQKKSRANKWRRRAGQMWLGLLACCLTTGSVWYLTVGEQTALTWFNKVEISMFGQASAAEQTADDAATADQAGKDDTAKSADAGDADKAKDAETGKTEGKKDAKTAKAQPKTWSDEEITLFTKLEERKKQLDAREASLNKLEEELQKQKSELEQKLAALQEVREKIAAKLEDKVKVDQQKVESLVSVYANMKPVQAAKVIEGINEDLAVEVLTKMKNKSAAEILNLMDAEKAKRLSERFAGYRQSASVDK